LWFNILWSIFLTRRHERIQRIIQIHHLPKISRKKADKEEISVNNRYVITYIKTTPRSIPERVNRPDQRGLICMRNSGFTLCAVAMSCILLGNAAFAQSGIDFVDEIPTLQNTRPVYGSEITLRLVDAPPLGPVTWFKSDADGSRVDELGRTTTDRDGNGFLIFTLIDHNWVGRNIVFWAEISRLNGPTVRSERREVRVDNPSFYVPATEPDGTGSIVKYDLFEGAIAGRSGSVVGSPGKIVFSRDGSLGFVLLDNDQIGIFSPFDNQWLIRYFPTGSGLLDLIASPDGSRIVVLCSEQDPLSDDGYVRGSLRIYRVDPDLDPEPETILIDAVMNSGGGRMLAMSEDSRLVYVRSGESAVGEYNLATGTYKNFFLDDNHPLSTVEDIQIHENCLVALVTSPGGDGFVCLANTQTYEKFYVAVGQHPAIFEVFDRASRPLVPVVHRTKFNEDVVEFLDIYSGTMISAIRGFIPPGVRDLEVCAERDLGVLLWVPGGDLGEKGYLGFFDKSSLSLNFRHLSVPVDSGSRVFLSRSPMINQCYVLSSSGLLSVIDLDSINFLRVGGESDGALRLDANSDPSSVEFY